MFHPTFGYYSSGRVRFAVDYQTYPIALAPFFGQMIAEQIFRMWQGMRRAGTLGPGERFTIAEFGAGNGLLAESILDYLDRQAEGMPTARWPEFAAQVLYVCYDRSSALSKAQRARNARFGKRFEAREADATDPTAAIPPGSLKGVILSNELPDAFSVHKVILSADGSAEVAFVAPSLPRTIWAGLRKDVPASVAEAVVQGDRDIRSRFFAGRQDQTYLTRLSFVALLEALASSAEYAGVVHFLGFHEVYVPAATVPELAKHLRRYASSYAAELAKNGQGVVTYINLGAEQFIQGAGRILKAGYVITLDYGSNWEGILAQNSHPHLRTYGPAQLEQNWNDGQPAGDQDTSDPYSGPTLNDMTTDVNFSLLAEAGNLAGLTAVYYGPQSALRSGTPISLPGLSQRGEDNDGLTDEFHNWADTFETDGNYKLMVQQKAATDALYSYPEKASERLTTDQNGWSQVQRQKAAEIEKRLNAAPEPVRPVRKPGSNYEADGAPGIPGPGF